MNVRISAHEYIVSKLSFSVDIYICSWPPLYFVSSYETLAIVVIITVILVIYESSLVQVTSSGLNAYFC